MAYIKVGYNKIPKYSVIDLMAKGLKKSTPGFMALRAHDPHINTAGFMSQRALARDGEKDLKEDYELVKKFWFRYPELRYLPVTGPMKITMGN
jgi:hypothetical protein